MTTSTFRFPSLGGRSGRLLAGLAIFGLLGSAAVLSGATPARADTGSFFVELDASAPTVAVGHSSTLTATTGVNVGPTPWFIDIYDKTTNTLLRACGSGTSCSVNVAEGVETTHTANTNVNVQDVSPSDPSVLIIYDETTGQMLGFTSVGDTYTAWTTPSEAGDYIVAFVEHYVQVQSQFFPPPAGTVEASSNVLLSRAFYG